MLRGSELDALVRLYTDGWLPYEMRHPKELEKEVLARLKASGLLHVGLRHRKADAPVWNFMVSARRKNGTKYMMKAACMLTPGSEADEFTWHTYAGSPSNVPRPQKIASGRQFFSGPVSSIRDLWSDYRIAYEVIPALAPNLKQAGVLDMMRVERMAGNMVSGDVELIPRRDVKVGIGYTRLSPMEYHVTEVVALE